MKRLFVIIAAALFPLIAFAQNAPDNFNKTPEQGNERIILQAWCWSFNTIRENMKAIAEAGFTTVQTPPAQLCVTQAKEALGDLAKSEEDVMSYICFPDQATKFLEARKAKEENKVTYTITEA